MLYPEAGPLLLLGSLTNGPRSGPAPLLMNWPRSLLGLRANVLAPCPTQLACAGPALHQTLGQPPASPASPTAPLVVYASRATSLSVAFSAHGEDRPRRRARGARPRGVQGKGPRTLDRIDERLDRLEERVERLLEGAAVAGALGRKPAEPRDRADDCKPRESELRRLQRYAVVLDLVP